MLIVVIHGHESSPWGEYASTLFQPQEWPFELPKQSYMMWLPVSMYHNEIKELASEQVYLLTWTKIIYDGLDYAQENIFPAEKENIAVAELLLHCLWHTVMI